MTAGAIAAAESGEAAPEEKAGPAEETPADMPPPVVEPVAAAERALIAANDELEATGRLEPVETEPEPELDPRALKALSRQERKEAKAALRREQQEARNAARQAKAMAKAAAKADRAAAAASAASDEREAPPAAMSQPASDEELSDQTAVDAIEPIEPDAPSAESDDAGEPAEEPEAAAAPAATDPRSRAAQRVQRRLGKDAEKLSAAEARARAREEARRRRAQAKEQRSGVVAEEAVRPPEGAAEGNLTEDVSVVDLTEQAIETEPIDATSIEEGPTDGPAEAEPVIDEPIIDEPIIDEVVDEPETAEELPEAPVVDEDVAHQVVDEPEPDLPEPLANQRIDEPAPVDVEDEPEPGAASRLRGMIARGDSDEDTSSRSSLAGGSSRSRGTIAGVVGLVALGISVLLAVGALLVALGFDSGGLYEALRAVANLLVGPLEGAFDFSGANAERKEHFLAWGAGSIGYLLISFVGQAVQRANDED